MKTKTIKISELVEDFDLYPRVSVDSGHVAQIVEALSAGAILPKIIAEEKTLRIVDGFHRARAYRRLYGDEHEIEIDTHRFESETDLFVEAMRLNAAHGRNMTSYDKAHAIARAVKMHIDTEAIATALNVTLDRIKEFRTERICKIENTRQVAPLKMPVRHMAGRVLTKAQADTIPKLGGNQQVFYVNQLIMLCESKMIDTENEILMERLHVLADILEKLLMAKR